jgi:hypothetical protein
MQLSHRIRTGLVALIAVLGVSFSSQAFADSGTISFAVYKAGWFIGGSGGSGVVVFHGQRYPITIGGLSAGFVFGASKTYFHGPVNNIRGPGDVSGVYGAGGAGAAVGRGVQAIVLTNEKGAVLALSGKQIGLQINADLSGMAITLK